MKTVDVWMSDFGPKLLEDMTREELVAALREIGHAYNKLLEGRAYERDLLWGSRDGRHV